MVSGTWNGSLMQKVVPWHGGLLTLMVPPWFSTMSRAMDRPSPVPMPRGLVV